MAASNTIVLNAVFENRNANQAIGKTNAELGKLGQTTGKVSIQSKDLEKALNSIQRGGGTGFRKVGTELDKVHDTVKRLAGVLGPLGEGLFKTITIPLGLLGFAAFEARRKLDTLERGLTQILGSSALASAKIKELAITARLPGLDFTNVVLGVSKLTAAGLGIGLATDAVKEFGNALALVGGTTEDLSGVILALQQIASKTRVSAEEINQIAERVPATRQLIFKAFGTADPEVLTKAGVTPRQFISTLVEEAKKLPRATSSLANEFKNFRDSLLRSFNEIGRAVEPVVKRVFGALTKAITETTAVFSNLSGPTQKSLAAVTLFAAAIGPLLVGLNLARAVISATIEGLKLLVPSYLKTTAAITTETAAIAANTAARVANAASVASRITASTTPRIGSSVQTAGATLFSAGPLVPAGRLRPDLAGSFRPASTAATELASKTAELTSRTVLLRAGWAGFALVIASKVIPNLIELGVTLDGIGQELRNQSIVRTLGDDFSEFVDQVKRRVPDLQDALRAVGFKTILAAEIAQSANSFKELVEDVLKSPLGTVFSQLRGFLERTGKDDQGRPTHFGAQREKEARELAAGTAAANAADPTRVLSEKERILHDQRIQQQELAKKALADAQEDALSGIAKIISKNKELRETYKDNTAALATLNKEEAIRINAELKSTTLKLQSERTQALAEGLGGVVKILDASRRAALEAEKAQGAALTTTQKQLVLERLLFDVRRFSAEETRKLWDKVEDQIDGLRERVEQITNQAREIEVLSTFTGDKTAILSTSDVRSAVTKAAEDADKEAIRRQQDDEIRQLEARKDLQLTNLELTADQTIQSKIRTEQAKANIETEFLQKSLAKQAKLLSDRTKLEIDEEQKKLAIDDTSGRNLIRVQREAATQKDIEILTRQTEDNITKIRTDAQVRQVQILRDAYQRTFDQFKDGAGRIFDALLLKTESFGDAVKNILKTALLTPVREFVTSFIAAMLTGQRAAGGFGRVGGGGGGGGITGFFSRAFGFGGGGLGSLGSIVGGPGGTGGFAGPVGGLGGFGGGGGVGGGGFGGFGGVGGFGGLAAAQGKGLIGLLGALGNLGRGIPSIPLGPGGTPVFNPVAGAPKGVGGTAGGALLAGGAILASLGLQRGGVSGIGLTAAGGGLIGAKFGGPLGAAIGASIGALAGLVRFFFKGAVQKIREKIKTAYGVNIQDNKLLQSFVDIAKQQFGGNLDVAIRSQQIRDLVELYAMSTGQGTGQFAQFRPPPVLTFSQGAGGLTQQPTFSNGTLTSSNVVSVGGSGVVAGVSSPPSISLTLDAEATVAVLEGRTATALQRDPRMAQTAVQQATNGSYLRRETARSLLQPSAVTR